MGNIEKFDSIANNYDTEERIKISKIIADTIRTYVDNGSKSDAIDYGCGTGIVGMELINDFNFITFIDASQNMVNVVKNKIEKGNIKNAKALCIDLVYENCQDLHADYIIMAQTLLHIKEVDQILLQLYNILNSEGHLLIVDFDKNEEIQSNEVHNGFNQSELISTLKSIGFVDAKGKTFYHGKNMFMKKDATLFIVDAVKKV